MGKREILTGLSIVLLMVATSWAGESVTISMSCTIPSIPGVNAPPNVPETLIRNQPKEDVQEKYHCHGRRRIYRKGGENRKPSCPRRKSYPRSKNNLYQVTPPPSIFPLSCVEECSTKMIPPLVGGISF